MTYKSARCLTVTYLSPVSFASLNGSDKEAENISSIKKLTRGLDEYPYGSSQWVRRALREQLANLGWDLSEGVASSIAKGAATTKQVPEKYIDDDLFGFMGTEKGDDGAKGRANKRTSPLRVSPLISLDKYAGDLDFGTNYMSVETGGDPNIFETEIHSGLYRGTILVELDRVGCGEGFPENGGLEATEKKQRVNSLLDALKNLWSTGRQTRFLADLSPKFLAGALLSVKNPVFLEVVQPANRGVNISLLEETVSDYNEEIIEYIYGVKKQLFAEVPEGTVGIGEAFSTMKEWINGHYSGK